MGVKGLGLTGTNYCEKWQKEQIYDRRDEFDNKYVRKGNMKEDDSIEYLAKVLNKDGIVKNEEYFENEYCTGTPDVFIGDDTIVDVKNSYSCFTFPLFEDETDEKYKPEYYAQAQVYMYLTGRRKYAYIFTLMDTPEELIAKEFNYKNKNGLSYEEFKKDYLYEHLGTDLRVKTFKVAYNEEYINTLIERVKECREHLLKIAPEYYDNK